MEDFAEITSSIREKQMLVNEKRENLKGHRCLWGWRGVMGGFAVLKKAR